jgi:ubiquinone/menaquinone biosynthesis C-methylase UbiE
MKNNLQKNAFLEFEANNWFDRNKKAILNFDKNIDSVNCLLKKYNIIPENVLEIGSSAGYRLDGIKKDFPESTVFGIDPSKSAISWGKKKYKDINLEIGTSDDLSNYSDDSMDLVIVGFVFYVVDRNLLFKTVNEINRVLKNGGYIILIDFYSGKTSQNIYHHIKGVEAFTYKQKYHELFTSSNTYFLMDFETRNHDKIDSKLDTKLSSLYCTAMLKKDLNEGY